MGKALRQEHITYFTARMDEHDRVVNWEPIANEYDFLFRIRRTLDGSRSDVIAHLTDAYRYGLAEFFARPNPLGAGSFVVMGMPVHWMVHGATCGLGAGSFVVMGMPHADSDPEVVEIAKKHRIGIGHIGKLMGALNYKNIWEYMTPDERRRKEEEQRRRKAEA